MKIHIDHNNLLSIENENIPQTKEYTYTVGGYTFSDYDKGMIVLHKKDIKIVNLKNLGDGMNVVYLQNKKHTLNTLDVSAVNIACTLFHGFDEISGQTYYFVPGLGEKQGEEKNMVFEKMNLPHTITKTAKGMIIQANPETMQIQTMNERLSVLFVLMLLYGKCDVTKNELASIKIQIPLFGQFLKHEEMLNKMIKDLATEGIFLKIDTLANSNGMTYQISTNDYELLEMFAKWYEPVEKFEKISKLVFTQEMKNKLLEFLESNSEIPEDGKKEVIEKIKSETIKFLMK